MSEQALASEIRHGESEPPLANVKQGKLDGGEAGQKAAVAELPAEPLLVQGAAVSRPVDADGLQRSVGNQAVSSLLSVNTATALS